MKRSLASESLELTAWREATFIVFLLKVSKCKLKWFSHLFCLVLEPSSSGAHTYTSFGMLKVPHFGQWSFKSTQVKWQKEGPYSLNVNPAGFPEGGWSVMANLEVFPMIVLKWPRQEDECLGSGSCCLRTTFQNVINGPLVFCMCLGDSWTLSGIRFLKALGLLGFPYLYLSDDLQSFFLPRYGGCSVGRSFELAAHHGQSASISAGFLVS